MSYWERFILKENFESVDLEDADVAYAAHLAGGEKFDVSPAAIVVVSKRYDVMEVEYGAVAFPHGKVDGVAAVEHLASCGDMN